LKFSKEKSVMVPLKGGLVPGFTASFDEGRIRSVQETKYLGLQLSEGLSFQNHAVNLLESSADVFSRLKSIRKSEWGVSAALSLLIYKAVYIPRILYGSNIWYPSAKNSDIKNKMESAQRRVLIAVTGAYNTVSTRALQVVGGTPPIFLHVESAIRISNGMTKAESEAILAEEWQVLWDGSSKGSWTKEFLPNINVRMHTPITFDHYTTQIISVHGNFNG